MMRGGTPALVSPSTRASGVRSYFFTASSDAISSAAAPSLTPDALPAVTVPPSLRNGVPSLASCSIVVSRGCSSFDTTIGSPLRWGIETGAISLAKRPLFWALLARICEL